MTVVCPYTSLVQEDVLYSFCSLNKNYLTDQLKNDNHMKHKRQSPEDFNGCLHRAHLMISSLSSPTYKWNEETVPCQLPDSSSSVYQEFLSLVLATSDDPVAESTSLPDSSLLTHSCLPNSQTPWPVSWTDWAVSLRQDTRLNKRGRRSVIKSAWMRTRKKFGVSSEN